MRTWAISMPDGRLTSLAAQLLVFDVRMELCRAIERRAPCVDRIAKLMGIEREDLWARLDGRLPLSLMDVSDIAFVRPRSPPGTFSGEIAMTSSDIWLVALLLDYGAWRGVFEVIGLASR